MLVRITSSSTIRWDIKRLWARKVSLFQAVSDPAEEVDLIERILESDRMLAEQARVARSLVADELAGRREKKRAVGAYREAASREI